jgi:hypothetical protein
MAKTSVKAAVKAIKESKGFVTQAAKSLGISRRQLHNIINNHPTVKEALEDAREAMKDFAEGKMFQGISDGNPTLIIFYAKTQMKDRGYVERQEITGADGGPIETVNIDYSKLSDDQLKRLAAGENPASVIDDSPDG